MSLALRVLALGCDHHRQNYESTSATGSCLATWWIFKNRAALANAIYLAAAERYARSLENSK